MPITDRDLRNHFGRKPEADRIHFASAGAVRTNKPARPSAMDAALSAIQAIPKLDSPIRFKHRVRTFIKYGPHHPGVWTRFERLIETAQDSDRAHSLSAARLYVEIEYRQEVEARRIAVANWGRCSRPRMTLNMLCEARLVLRWMQRHAPGDYAGVRDAILSPELAQAAE